MFAAKEEPRKNIEPVVVKKYANRRLYNTDTSTYVTLDDLCELVKKNVDFVVYDAKSGEDLTRQILTQIIFEQESKGYSMLPIGFLRSIIGFYDNKVQEFVPHYLEAMMKNFSANQERVKQYMDTAVGGLGTYSPFSQMEEFGKKNMAFFGKAMEMFNPLGYFGGKPEEDERPQEKKRAGKKG